MNNYGQLGHGDITNRDKLTKIQHFVGRDIVKVEGGMHFSCFVDNSSKELYECGRGEYGNLGITLEQPDAGYCETLPVRVPLAHEPDIKSIIERNIDRKANCIIAEDIVETDQPEIEQISCGSTHVLVLAKLPNTDSRVGSSHSLATSKLVMENILNSPPRGRFFQRGFQVSQTILGSHK